MGKFMMLFVFVTLIALTVAMPQGGGVNVVDADQQINIVDGDSQINIVDGPQGSGPQPRGGPDDGQ